MNNIQSNIAEAFDLLQKLIAIESFSRQEDEAADLVAAFLKDKGLDVQREGNNVWCWATLKDETKPVILLNSHIDTVKPSNKWTYPPFTPTKEGDVLYGLGSNDAGGPLVSLLATFLALKDTKQSYNLVFAASAEEEISGPNGIASILEKIGQVDLGIVGEPTQMDMAIAEKGLMVLDCEAYGKSGHAAREEGINSIYKALEDIEWFRTYQFPDTSELFGPVKMTVTQIEAGTQHNVIPDSCKFVVDVRVNEKYTNLEALEHISERVSCKVAARSTRLNSSSISLDHPIVKKGLALKRKYYGSPTTSDQALMNFTTIKIGPGDSARSHTADEYIKYSEIKYGIETYIQMLDQLEL